MLYVDPLGKYGMIFLGRKCRSCHLFSDNGREELVQFARLVRIPENWIHNSRSGLPHIDLTPMMREKVILNGAEEISREEALKIWKRLRGEV